MRFLVDNALAPRVADGLRDHGHDAIHVRDMGLGSAPDEKVFAVAQAEGRTLISTDTDFGVLLAASHRVAPSLILFRRSDKRPGALLDVLLANLDRVADDIAAGCVIVFEDARIRIRKLPI